MMKFRCFGDSTISRDLDKLKTIRWSCGQITYKRMTIINFKVNDRNSNSASSSLINSITNTS